MATIKRFIKAIKDYYQSNQVGDIAFLKIDLLRIGANPDLTTQLQEIAGYYPTVDLEKLSQLPEGTLGYEYARHMQKHNLYPLEISPDLIEAAKANPFALRFTATHDIFHILLGFDTTYAGEIGVIGFMIGQNYSKFLNTYEPVAKRLYPLIFLSQAEQIRTNLRRGKAIGEQAQCLLAYRFEENWERSIADIRSELGLAFADEQIERELNTAITNSPTPETIVA
ncbi:MAG: Coq4 family protein [Spirulinaceae cyanobacterium]